MARSDAYRAAVEAGKPDDPMEELLDDEITLSVFQTILENPDESFTRYSIAAEIPFSGSNLYDSSDTKDRWETYEQSDLIEEVGETDSGKGVLYQLNQGSEYLEDIRKKLDPDHRESKLDYWD